MGYFNDILSPDDKCGCVEHPAWLIRGFREIIDQCNLVDLPLLGYPFNEKRKF